MRFSLSYFRREKSNIFMQSKIFWAPHKKLFINFVQIIIFFLLCLLNVVFNFFFLWYENMTTTTTIEIKHHIFFSNARVQTRSLKCKVSIWIDWLFRICISFERDEDSLTPYLKEDNLLLLSLSLIFFLALFRISTTTK